MSKHQAGSRRARKQFNMLRTSLLAVIIVFVAPALSAEKSRVSLFGAYGISPTISSMWLAGPDHRALLMVYFHGPEGWHNAQWKLGWKFGNGKPGWAELRSDKVTLRLSLNVETGEAEVQSREFNVTESNTFLVLHAGEPSIPPKIIALGVFDLPFSKKKPASVLLLEENPELMGRIKKEVAAGES